MFLLGKIASSALTLPYSKAAKERVFNDKKNKTELRPNLDYLNC